MTLAPGEFEGSLEILAEEERHEGEAPKEIEGRSLGQLAWRTLKHDRVAMAGGIVAIVFIIMGFGAPLITKWYGQNTSSTDYNVVDAGTNLPIGGWGGISGTHWLGVAPVGGQDIFAQVLFGMRTSLIIGGLATCLSLIFGVGLGLIAGFYRGGVDTLLSRLMDLLLSFPTTLFSIALVTVFGLVPTFAGLSGTPLRFATLIFVLGFFGFPYIGRIVRGQVLSLREKEFVDAARSLGASNYRIISREILPNVIGPVLVYATLTIPNYILGEAGLSFIGAGVNPPTVSLGGMLNDAANYFQVDPEYLFTPGLALFILVLSFNLFGDGLRDALDPRSRR